MSPGRKLLACLAPAATLAVLLGAGAEIGLRLAYRDVSHITGLADWEVASYESLTYHWDVYHPLYGWANLPGYRSDGRVPFTVTINRQGLRAQREYAPFAPAGVRRVAVLGDSCTFGEEVDDDQTLPHHLERFLANAEVLNFGVHGYGLGEMFLQLDEVLTYRPDLVLLVLTLPSDFGRTVATHFVHEKPAFRLEKGDLVLVNNPVPTSLQQHWLLRRSYAAAWLFGRPASPATGDEVGGADDLAVSRALLGRFAARCRERGVPLVAISIVGPSWAAMGPGTDSYAVIEECRRIVRETAPTTIDHVDFLRDLLGTGGGLISPSGVHWLGRGNCLLAEELARILAVTSAAGEPAVPPPACAKPR